MSRDNKETRQGEGAPAVGRAAYIIIEMSWHLTHLADGQKDTQH